MEEVIREGNLNRLGGGEGVTREHLEEKGSGGQQMPRIRGKNMPSLGSVAAEQTLRLKELG